LIVQQGPAHGRDSTTADEGSSPLLDQDGYEFRLLPWQNHEASTVSLPRLFDGDGSPAELLRVVPGLPRHGLQGKALYLLLESELSNLALETQA
jgi:hypothetical protein